MDTFANHLYTERHRWDERLRICFWQLTGHMASLIIFHVSAGEYQKQLGEDQVETRVAYEISVSKLDLVTESDEVTAASEIVDLLDEKI